jgi:hypothetical protein
MGQTVVLALFWTLSVIFAAGLIGSAMVVIWTTIDDLKEIFAKEEEPKMSPSATHFVPAD